MQDDGSSWNIMHPSARQLATRFQRGQSGNPSGRQRPKRFIELREQIVRDLGGFDALSGIDAVIVDQAVTLLLKAERTRDVNLAVRASNAGARLLGSLRHTKRRHANNTLGDILKAGAAHG
jgi:Family of unknown function (DUF5681)